MAYTIAYTDQANKGTITVEDGTINQETDLRIPGRNTTAYGSSIAQNFLHLLENFASATEPSRPVEGQLWYNSTPGEELLYVYDGTNWVTAGGLKRGDNEPEAVQSQIGDLWVDTDNQQLYLFSGSQWILVGPQFSDGLVTGVTPDVIIGTDNQNYSIVKVEVDAQPVAIVSSAAFSPKTTIAGFTAGLQPGINISTANITGAGAPKFVGTSEKAESLIVDNEAVSLNIQNNTGVTLGTDAALNIGVEGQAGIIQHQIEGSNIDLRVKNSGSTRTVIRVDASLRVGVNNEAPDEALDVIGNIKTDSGLLVNGTTESTTFGTGSIIAKGGAGIAKNLNVGGTAKVTGLTTLADVVPDGNNTRNLGSPTQKWQNVYSTTFVGNLTGNVSGTVSGAAGSAFRLTSSTNFVLTGDVSSDTIVFDGATGGSTKTFNTTISNAFVGDRDAVSDVNNDDELLINRVSGGTQGLFKMTTQTLLNEIPRFPIGAIIPYAGTEASVPVGWELCDGRKLETSFYGALADVLSNRFDNPDDPAGTGQFYLPDLRGRFP